MSLYCNYGNGFITLKQAIIELEKETQYWLVNIGITEDLGD